MMTRKERAVVVSMACNIRDRAQASIALGKLSRQKDFTKVAIMTQDSFIAGLAAEKVDSRRYLKKISSEAKTDSAKSIAEMQLYGHRLTAYDM